MIDQLAIFILGVAAVFLSQDHREALRRWAPVLGLVSQPFWFYAAWNAGQWGVFTLAIFYTVAWMTGIYNFWVRK